MTVEIAKLRKGHAIRVKFGQNASQIAVVDGFTRAGNLRAYKYSAKRKVWKGPLRVEPGEILSAVPASAVNSLPTPCPLAPRNYGA